MRHHVFPLLLRSILLVACGSDQASEDARAQGGDALPKPGAVNGSVTGMPDPGTASAARGPARAPDVVELPGQIEADQEMAGDPALQATPDETQPALAIDQPDLEVLNDSPQEDATPPNAAGIDNPSPPKQ